MGERLDFDGRIGVLSHRWEVWAGVFINPREKWIPKRWKGYFGNFDFMHQNYRVQTLDPLPFPVHVNYDFREFLEGSHLKLYPYLLICYQVL